MLCCFAQSIGSVEEVISMNSQPASDVDSNTTDDNKNTQMTTNDESWTDVNLNEETVNEDPRNIHNMSHFRGRLILSVPFEVFHLKSLSFSCIYQIFLSLLSIYLFFC